LLAVLLSLRRSSNFCQNLEILLTFGFGFTPLFTIACCPLLPLSLSTYLSIFTGLVQLAEKQQND